MKKKLSLMFVAFSALAILAGCEPLTILDPKGPNAKTLSDTIILSIITMAFILLVVYVLLIFMLTKYRASKAPANYEPPHEEGSHLLEITWTVIPIIIVAFLAIVTVRTTSTVEAKPDGYDNQEPLVIYASSSNWKWHFSYPEQGIETVNYVNIPVDRPIEFKLYSFGPITSFWIPQLAGQKYAMSDMLTTIHLAADEVGSYMGRNSNFSGRGFAEMEFEAQSMTQEDFDKWVSDVKANEKPLTKEKFDELLKAEHVGRSSYSSTHLEFSPAPMEHSEHMNMSDKEMDHSKMNHEGHSTDSQENSNATHSH
ncbi:cytochrome aa3 quinol oxidase subunit II [Lysinibacillus pakistanensis]|uniref:Quinol oxidase subunit 2 n=1 Tax=Lysinibacillus pakistanensis TaxID=759811 RepID=A0AAX3WUA9_9BACI|nr:cytochrome aa3 quinol oxidase subunit II [Lysinibacillus pakistanensis]MDM5229711.1 cytochrome aa3 quinol oxidase subunit II [Lysinibacillus pakistanensis]QGG52571.1 cytochrome aa3 quinol oxidase subunit II [Lysinibacillus pakistanensis]WHY45320.1 cytochrome aa3 quinol oxidase subunit II [Lysinibacillus pakistanensis]WHY50328.1 cytochrome aa3 quinol oxidase subunit II [Lysinibacillus pakistanensis]